MLSFFHTFFVLILIRCGSNRKQQKGSLLKITSKLEQRSVTFNTALSNFSFCVSILFLIFGIGFMVFHIWILRRLQKLSQSRNSKGKKKKKETFLNKYKEFGILFEQWKGTSFTQSAYLLLFTLRDIGLNLVISNLFEHLLVQTIFFVLLTSSFFVYLIVKRPFKRSP